MAPDASAPARITLRICEAIKAQIASGHLSPGARVPSTRALAAEWGVSRTTVTAAYEQLIAEGYLEARQGARTQVAPGLGRIAAPPGPASPPQVGSRLSAYGERLDAYDLPAVSDRGAKVAEFRYGDLAAADFPKLAWKKAVSVALLRRHGRLRYGDPRGSGRLREALQGYLWRARGLRCTPDQIVIVNGSQQGLDLCARLLVDPGDRVLMEDPGYALARQIFHAVGADVVPVAVDRDGLRTDALPAARLAYTTPSHQFPLGGVLSAGRRRELLAWAQQAGGHVIEDDYDSEYRFDIAPIPPLQALDETGRVIYVGTVSKTLSPTLRLGYLVVPPSLSVAFARAKRLTDRQSPSLEQEALAELIESGAYERHVRRVRRRNGERRAALLAALAGTVGDAVTVVGADAGLHVVAWLNTVPRADEAQFISRAQAVGLGLYPISPLYALDQDRAPSDSAGLVMGYASLDEPAIRRGVRLLGELLAEFASDHGSGRQHG
ncbi:PLP-dependent aminotransferase family protein [Roseomonas terrae]|uniref:PLP-dependent aminotransferase family protein n=1 Tax=Neoroseomonas terrae TaxID=424799 RepID=A0ABS5EM08_9PROT|nr:PLP-dependent aminotransferase family protein [Neoroseomonas terrae]MBR0652064.1 PLP-dependent aminotransferase family protein [Neoroseomonas terrae]